MFTLEQINAIQDGLGEASTLPQYLESLKAIGVLKCDTFISDGHSEYVGENDYKVASPAAHEALIVGDVANKDAMLNHLDLHSQGKIDPMQMSQGLAESGVEKWTFDTTKMTMAYYDKAGNEMLAESLLEQ